jgi:hypothetical protein
MKYIKTKIILFIVSCTILYGCSLTKKVPRGEYLLTKNSFEIEEKESPFKSNLPDYVKQKPNGAGLLGALPFKLMFYNSVPAKFDTAFIEYYDLSKKRRNQHSLDSLLSSYGLDKYVGRSLWLKRFIFNQGERPVLIDSALTEFSTENIEKYYFDRGYFDAEAKFSMDLDSLKKKGKVKYDVKTGEKSIIQSYNYTIKDSAVQKHVETLLQRGTKIKVDERYDLNNFMEEKDRIVDFLKNRGYWRFNDDALALEFTADTTNTDKLLDVTLLIPVGKGDSTLIKQKFYRYRYGNIHLYPDGPYNDEKVYFDTIYEGYNLHYENPKMKYRPKFFTDAIVVRDSALYRVNSETQTKRNILKREGINLVGFATEVDKERMIENDSVLNLHISFRPKKKYDLFYGAEISWSEFMNFGVSPQASLLVRNLFRGGENLETSVKGTLGNVNKKFATGGGFFNAFEMAFQSKLGFPYLLIPFNTDRILPKRFYKQTDFRLGASVQNNIGLGRVTYSTGLDYTISFRDTHSHSISIFNTEFVNNLQKDNYFSVFEGDNFIKNNFFSNYYFPYHPQTGYEYYNEELTDVEVIDMIYQDQLFLNSLDSQGLEDLSIFENMNFRRQTITQDVLILSLVYQYTLNQNERANKKNPWFFRGRVEFAGNLLNLMDKSFGFYQTETTPGTESGTVFNVPYSQFIKVDLDVRKYFELGSKSTLATRAYLGLVQPYGNTDFIPFVRSYTAGGANDNRAWAAATLGPAALPRYAGGDDVFAIERLKLLLSTEYRFNVFDRVNSALFIDAGNIWGTDKKEELTLFKFNNFYKELGIGAGFGLRLDLTYFLLRFDFAYKIHDPSYPIGSRWRFQDLNLFKPRLAFGINYPF